MARLEWDKIDERLYESGIDHGVLYIPSSPGVYDDGVVWNGLTSIQENYNGDSTQAHYYDGVKYLDSYKTGDFSATLTAFTYPDEFLVFEGFGSFDNNTLIDDQSSKVFGLSYRTRAGNYSEGLNFGYKIHLLYNLVVKSDDITYQNGESPEPIDFSWEIASVPEVVPNYRPTAHVILDSRLLAPNILDTIEGIIYGRGTSYSTDIIDGGYAASPGSVDVLDGGTAFSSGPEIVDGNITLVDNQPAKPRLPPLTELVDLALGWNPRIISPQIATGLAQLINGVGDLSQAKIPGLYVALPDTRLVRTDPAGFYQLES